MPEGEVLVQKTEPKLLLHEFVELGARSSEMRAAKCLDELGEVGGMSHDSRGSGQRPSAGLELTEDHAGGGESREAAHPLGAAHPDEVEATLAVGELGICNDHARPGIGARVVRRRERVEHSALRRGVIGPMLAVEDAQYVEFCDHGRDFVGSSQRPGLQAFDAGALLPGQTHVGVDLAEEGRLGAADSQEQRPGVVDRRLPGADLEPHGVVVASRPCEKRREHAVRERPLLLGGEKP